MAEQPNLWAAIMQQRRSKIHGQRSGTNLLLRCGGIRTVRERKMGKKKIEDEEQEVEEEEKEAFIRTTPCWYFSSATIRSPPKKSYMKDNILYWLIQFIC